jgi:hypothetical protein
MSAPRIRTATVVSENGYPLCARHARQWASGGNDARMVSIRRHRDEYPSGTQCADCAEA